MQIAQNDPRINAGAMAAQQAVLSTIYAMKPGMSQADAVQSAGAISNFISRTEQALFKDGRIDDILAGRYVDLEGHRVDAPAGGASGRPAIDDAMRIYQREFQQNLQQLKLSPNGPNAADILEHLRREPTPGQTDVTGHSWLQALITSLGAGTDKPQPARQPSRIGTESR